MCLWLFDLIPFGCSIFHGLNLFIDDIHVHCSCWMPPEMICSHLYNNLFSNSPLIVFGFPESVVGRSHFAYSQAISTEQLPIESIVLYRNGHKHIQGTLHIPEFINNKYRCGKWTVKLCLIMWSFFFIWFFSFFVLGNLFG